MDEKSCNEDHRTGDNWRTRIVDELAAIAFADICNVVDWDRSVEKRPTKADGPVGKAIPVFTSTVTVRPSATMDPAVSRTISKVVTSDKGGLRVEMHDKLVALDKLARTLGMYTDNLDVAGNCLPPTAVITYSGRPANWPAPGDRAAKAVDAPRDDD